MERDILPWFNFAEDFMKSQFRVRAQFTTDMCSEGPVLGQNLPPELTQWYLSGNKVPYQAGHEKGSFRSEMAYIRIYKRQL